MKEIVCLSCGEDKLVERNDDYLWDAFYLKGPTKVPNMPRYECPTCGDIVVNGAAIDYAQPYLRDNYTDEYKAKLAKRKSST